MEKYWIVGAALLVGILLVGMLLDRSRTGRSRTAQRLGADLSRRGGLREHWILGQGAYQHKAWHIGQRVVTVGRGVGNYVQLLDESVSRIQCQLQPDDRGMLLIDKAQRSNTFVNGQRVERHRLIDGDVIRLGDTELVYRSHGDFGDDEGMGRKEVGERVAKPTQMQGMNTVRDMLEAALRECHGDTERAAAHLGMRHDLFLNSLKAQGLRASDFQS